MTSPIASTASTASAPSTRTASAARPLTTVVTLLAASLVAVGATWVIAVAAVAAGANPAYGPLQLPVFGAFAVAGVLAGHLGWRIVRRVVARPARVLRILVPAVLALSFVPDIVLLATGFIPGTTTPAVVALMLMHAVVAAIVLPVSLRLAPVRD